MRTLLELIPDHIRPLIEVGDEYKVQVRSFDCFCIAALYHYPELLTQMTDNASDNTDLARRVLFSKGNYQVVSTSSPHSINAYFSADRRLDWQEHSCDHIFHVSVNLPFWYVLSKNGPGASRCQIAKKHEDESVYYRANPINSAIMIPRVVR